MKTLGQYFEELFSTVHRDIYQDLIIRNNYHNCDKPDKKKNIFNEQLFDQKNYEQSLIKLLDLRNQIKDFTDLVASQRNVWRIIIDALIDLLYTIGVCDSRSRIAEDKINYQVVHNAYLIMELIDSFDLNTPLNQITLTNDKKELLQKYYTNIIQWNKTELPDKHALQGGYPKINQLDNIRQIISVIVDELKNKQIPQASRDVF